jgi:hypothetical protein
MRWLTERWAATAGEVQVSVAWETVAWTRGPLAVPDILPRLSDTMAVAHTVLTDALAPPCPSHDSENKEPCSMHLCNASMLAGRCSKIGWKQSRPC